MTRRSLSDPVWAEEVVRRWQRRSWRVQQREAAWSALVEALDESVVGRFVRWLAVRLG